jgi:cholesterol transport system auxiliary component
MRRRRALATMALALAAAGCSVLPSQPYLQRQDWPLTVSPPDTAPPARRGKTLLVRNLQAAPGLNARGLRVLQPNGSVKVEFYDQWAVLPADGVTDDLKRWLEASGLFAAVLAPGSIIQPDLTLEGELTALHADIANNTATVALALVLIDQHPNPAKILLQKTVRASVPLGGTTTPDLVHAQIAALEQVLARSEADIAAAMRR